MSNTNKKQCGIPLSSTGKQNNKDKRQKRFSFILLKDVHKVDPGQNMCKELSNAFEELNGKPIKLYGDLQDAIDEISRYVENNVQQQLNNNSLDQKMCLQLPKEQEKKQQPT